MKCFHLTILTTLLQPWVMHAFTPHMRPNKQTIHIQHPRQSTTTTTQTYQTKSSKHEVNRRDTVAATSLLTIIATLLHPSPANAERTLGTITESYRRYVPRMETGFFYLANDIGTLIEKGEYEEVKREITAESGTKISAMKGTMRIFATAFSDSVVSTTTRELQLALFKTNQELDNLVASGTTNNKDQAMEAYNQALFFAQVYSETANAAIPRSLDPIKGPKGVGKRIADRDLTVTGSF